MAHPAPDDAARRQLRQLLRTIPAEVVGEEVDDWLREGGPGTAEVRQLLLSAHKADPRAARSGQVSAPCVRERDEVLGELRERNKVASNVGFDIIVRPLEEKAAEERSDEVLTDHAWLQLVRMELGPALRSSTLSRVSPDRRGRVWRLCARVKRVRAAADAGPGYFEQLVAKADRHRSEANEDISRDLGRSMPDVAKIASPEGQQRLRRCLSAYALHNADLGYCQGMNFIAAVLQLHLPAEEDAFWCLDVIVTKAIPGGLSRSLTGFKVSVLVLCDLAKTLLPDCYLDLEGLGIPVEDVLGMICPQWFISLFVNALPLDLVFKFWDLVFLEGSIAVFQLALAILETFAHHLGSSGQPFPSMAPDYVAQLIRFSRGAGESEHHAILARRARLARLLTADKIKGVWTPNEARVREEVRAEELQRQRLARERRLEYQVAKHIHRIVSMVALRFPPAPPPKPSPSSPTTPHSLLPHTLTPTSHPPASLPPCPLCPPYLSRALQPSRPPPLTRNCPTAG